MRIVGGEFRGRRLAVPAGRSIRPTTDRTRQSLFNILTHQFGDELHRARVLDVFAGTGALGLEALSRGADFVAFLEKGAEGAALIRKNISTLNVAHQTRLLRFDATRLSPLADIEPFDLVLMDPPYARSLGQLAAVQLQKKWMVKGRDAAVA